jgi:hypothetical protein
MPRLPYVASGSRGTRHLIASIARTYLDGGFSWSEGPPKIRIEGQTACDQGIDRVELAVGDTEVGAEWCRNCLRRRHRAATCAHESLVPLGRSPEEVWVSMVREIASAVDRLAPQRARFILAELLRRAPIADGFAGRNVTNELGEVWRDTVAGVLDPRLERRLEQLEESGTGSDT